MENYVLHKAFCWVCCWVAITNRASQPLQYNQRNSGTEMWRHRVFFLFQSFRFMNNPLSLKYWGRKLKWTALSDKKCTELPIFYTVRACCIDLHIAKKGTYLIWMTNNLNVQKGGGLLVLTMVHRDSFLKLLFICSGIPWDPFLQFKPQLIPVSKFEDAWLPPCHYCCQGGDLLPTLQ